MHRQTYVQYASSTAISIYYKILKLVLLQLLASRLQSQRRLQSSKVFSSRHSPIISGSHLTDMISFVLSNRKDELANLPESCLTARRNGITWHARYYPATTTSTVSSSPPSNIASLSSVSAPYSSSPLVSLQAPEFSAHRTIVNAASDAVPACHPCAACVLFQARVSWTDGCAPPARIVAEGAYQRAPHPYPWKHQHRGREDSTMTTTGSNHCVGRSPCQNTRFLEYYFSRRHPVDVHIL